MNNNIPPRGGRGEYTYSQTIIRLKIEEKNAFPKGSLESNICKSHQKINFQYQDFDGKIKVVMSFKKH